MALHQESFADRCPAGGGVGRQCGDRGEQAAGSGLAEHRRPGGERAQLIAEVLHLAREAPGPAQQLFRRLADLRGEGLRLIDQPARPFRESPQQPVPGEEVGRRLREEAFQLAGALLQRPEHVARDVRRWLQGAQRLRRQPQGVGQPVARRGAVARGVGLLAQPLAQRQQRGQQVAAVHGGDVRRRQDGQRPRVVPVVEVPVEAL